MERIYYTIPEEAYGVMVQNYGNGSELIYMIELSDTDETIRSIDLPDGQWNLFSFENGVVTLHSI